MEWAKLHRTFGANRWDTVAFSYESSFTVRPIKLLKQVWRISGTGFNNENLVPTFKSGFVSISVWAVFSARGWTPLIRINSTLNKEKYQTILESVLKVYSKVSYWKQSVHISTRRMRTAPCLVY